MYTTWSGDAEILVSTLRILKIHQILMGLANLSFIPCGTFSSQHIVAGKDAFYA